MLFDPVIKFKNTYDWISFNIPIEHFAPGTNSYYIKFEDIFDLFTPSTFNNFYVGIDKDTWEGKSRCFEDGATKLGEAMIYLEFSTEKSKSIEVQQSLIERVLSRFPIFAQLISYFLNLKQIS